MKDQTRVSAVLKCMLVGVILIAMTGCDKHAEQSGEPSVQQGQTASDSVAAKPRVNEARWSEGRAAMVTIATYIRAYVAENGPQGRPPRDLSDLGLTPYDLRGNYFGPEDYTFSVSSMDPMTFVVTCTPGSRPNAPMYPAKRTLDSNGKWTPE